MSGARPTERGGTDVGGTAETEPLAPVRVGGRPMASETVAIVNPARPQETVGRVALGGTDHVDAAVAAAADAFPEWSRLSPHERAAALGRAAETLRSRLDVDALARLLTREHGKVLDEAYVDLRRGIAVLDYYAGLADELVDETTEDARGRVVVARRPMGVAGVIVPWNYPVILGLQMVAPALLAGNTVVVKPAVEVTLAFSEVLRVLADALPAGVVNSVPGEGGEAGHALVTHPGVRKLAFTGSVATGQQILRNASDDIKRVTLELGGNDPALILESAEVDERMLAGLVKGVYTSTGQICYNVKRIYVHQRHYETFVERFCDHVDALVVGEGLDPASDIGPLNSRVQLDKAHKIVDEAQARGARVRWLGHKGDSAAWDDGYFLQPAVVTEAPDDSDLVADEQFGPVVPIIPVASDEEAIARANDSPYGLTASVWTADEAYGFSLAPQLEAGSVFVNVHRVGASDVSMPFGGFKRSGLGRSHGLVAVEENTELQAVIRRDDM